MEFIEILVNAVKSRIVARFSLFALLALAPAFTPSAHAVPEYYQLSGGSVTALSSEPGLVLQTAIMPTLPGTAFTLNDGTSATFDFFEIWTNEPTINPDDKVPNTISATLNFADPLTGGTVTGITVGGSYAQGATQWGAVTWNGPVTITLAGDRVFTISLTDETFNYGFFGLAQGQMCGAIVQATVTQLSSVPDTGSTAMLLGAALAAIGFFAHKRGRA